MTDQSAFNRWRARSWSPKLIATVVLCFVAGLMVSWWVNRPVPPWLEFGDVQANYVKGSRAIQVEGTYTATKTCDGNGGMDDGREPLIWRQEVEGSGPQIVNYAPRPAPPDLQLGTHEFRTEIPLDEGIDPDGWRVSILVTCTETPFAIRSESATVTYVDPSGGVVD
jgi:hypothetical protein